MTIPTLEPTSRTLVRPRAGILAREIGGEMVLLDVEEATYYGLNEVGTRVWSLFVEGATLSEIEERLLVEFEVSREILEADLGGLLRDLAEHGLIDVILPHSSAG
ncbi:MAG: PqqD family protein [Acidobacteriota bacterium]